MLKLKQTRRNSENYSYTTPSKKSTPKTPFKIFNAIPDSSTKDLVNSQKEPDNILKSVPDVIERKIDRIVSKSDKNPGNNLRRSGRNRRTVSREGFVPTADVIPARGEIPIFDNSSKDPILEICESSSKPSYQNSLSALLREKRIRDKTGYNHIDVSEQALENDMLNETKDPYDQLEIPGIRLEDANFEHLRQIHKEHNKSDQDYQIELFGTMNSNPQIPNLQTVVLNNDPTFDLLLKAFSDKRKLKDILCNNWINYQFEIEWRLPTEVIIWHLHLACYGEDEIISEASSNTLKGIAGIKGGYGRSSKDRANCINVPFSEIYNILTALGASKRMTSLRYCLKQNIMQVDNIKLKILKH